MPNLDLLNNIIALVVVILLLSLIVQSLQSLFKKLLNMKSTQIEDSLLDLFDSVLREKKAAPAADGTVKRPRSLATARAGIMNMLTIFPSSPTHDDGSRAQQLLKAVRAEMSELGRLDFRGKFALDSLSKADLLNVIARVAPDTIVDNFTDRLAAAMRKIKEIENTITRVNEKASSLPGEANALFARLQEAMAPLQQHYRSLVKDPDTEPDAAATTVPVKAGVVVADILALRQVLFNETLDLLGKTQRIVAEEKKTAAEPELTALKEVEKGLAAVAAAINSARKALDDAFGGFKAKLTEIESWFDTVMQGFEERYHRGMKSLSIILGAVVVVLLNANVFAIYQSISVNEALRDSLVNKGSDIAELQEQIARDEKIPDQDDVTPESTAAATETSPGTTSATDTATTASDTGTVTAPATESNATSPVLATETASNSSAIETVAPSSNAGTNPLAKSPQNDAETKSSKLVNKDPSLTPKQRLSKNREELAGLVDTYTMFGFKPLTWRQFLAWGKDLVDCETNPETGSWLSRRGNDFRTILGWLVMTMLLSLGAPFWHDALQSLFGVKNLLQKKNEQRNIEEKPGAGNPAA